MPANLDQNLEDLEGVCWGDPEFGSHLVTECHRLRRVPLKHFTVEDLRLMIGQEVGLSYLVPLAIEHLEKDPLVEGDYYPGDLLKNVLGIPKSFWTEHADFRARMLPITEQALRLVDAITDANDEIEGDLKRQLSAFISASQAPFAVPGGRGEPEKP